VLKFLIEKKRILIIAGAVLISVLLLFSLFSGDDPPKKKSTPRSTTTTTLPDKQAPACEFLTEEALMAGGIIPDVDPKTSDDKRRCTYQDIGGNVNYITLYVDTLDKCDVLIQGLNDPKEANDVAEGAKFFDETDPTIVVPQGNRCFFVQGSKTILNRTSLTQIAIAVADLFKAVDSSTTTTTSSTVVLPETQLTLPGQNTATTASTAPATQKVTQ